MHVEHNMEHDATNPNTAILHYSPVCNPTCHTNTHSKIAWIHGMALNTIGENAPTSVDTHLLRDDGCVSPWQPSLRACTWNGKACFPAKHCRANPKLHGIKKIMNTHDICFLQETHLSRRSLHALRKFVERLGCFVFAYAGSQQAGGIAVIVKQKFLEDHFAHAVWEEIIPGRLGCLRCNGGHGGATFFNAHFFLFQTMPDERPLTQYVGMYA